MDVQQQSPRQQGIVYTRTYLWFWGQAKCGLPWDCTPHICVVSKVKKIAGAVYSGHCFSLTVDARLEDRTLTDWWPLCSCHSIQNQLHLSPESIATLNPVLDLFRHSCSVNLQKNAFTTSPPTVDYVRDVDKSICGGSIPTIFSVWDPWNVTEVDLELSLKQLVVLIQGWENWR